MPVCCCVQYMSTSPAQEPPTFEAHIRACLQQIKDHPEPMKTLFQGGRPRCYKKLPDGQWERVWSSWPSIVQGFGEQLWVNEDWGSKQVVIEFGEGYTLNNAVLAFCLMFLWMAALTLFEGSASTWTIKTEEKHTQKTKKLLRQGTASTPL